MSKEYFKRLINMDERKNIQEISRNVLRDICENIINKSEHFYNHADIFSKLAGMKEGYFRAHIKEIINEVEEDKMYNRLKEIDKIKKLNEWFTEQEKLLEQHWLHPMEQQCQEMYSLLLKHADKSQSFDTRTPEDFRAFLEGVRVKYGVAKSQLEAYSAGKADISVKDSAITTLRKIHYLFKSLKGALNKYLLEVKESADKIQQENEQNCNELLIYIERSRIFADQELEEYKKKFERITNRNKAASSQIQRYLSGTDTSEDEKCKAFEMLEKNSIDIKEIEENINSLLDMRLHVNKIDTEIQKIYKRLLECANQSQSFMSWDPQEFKENLKRIRDDHKRAYAGIKRYISGKDKSEENRTQTLEKLEMCLGEIKEIEKRLDMFLLKKLDDSFMKTRHKILVYIERSEYFAKKQRRDFVEDLEDMNRRREQAKSTIENYFMEFGMDREKKCDALSVIEDMNRKLDLSLSNEVNAEIVRISNMLNKKGKYITSDEKEEIELEERLENIEDQRKNANSKLEAYFSGDDISEKKKCSAFEALEKCLEKTKIVEIDMIPFLMVPMIQKIDEGYADILEYANQSPIFAKQELNQLYQDITDIKEHFSTIDEEDEDSRDLLKESFDELSKLERKMSLFLQFQLLHSNYLKVSNGIENRLNNMTQVDSETRKSLRESLKQNKMNARNKFEEVKEVIIDPTIPVHREYIREIALDEYHKSIENLRRQAYQLLGVDVRLSSPRSG